MSNIETDVLNLRARVAELESQVQFLYKHLSVTYMPEPVAGYDSEIVEHLKKGDTIGAIQLHRAKYKSSLADAKKAVEELKARLGY